MKSDRTQIIKKQKELLPIYSFILIILGGLGYVCFINTFDLIWFSNLYLGFLFLIGISLFICYAKVCKSGYAIWFIRIQSLQFIGFITAIAPYFIVGVSTVLGINQVYSFIVFMCLGFIMLASFFRGGVPQKYWKTNMTRKCLKTKKKYDLYHGKMRVYKESTRIDIWSGRWAYLSPVALIPGILIGKAVVVSLNIGHLMFIAVGLFISYIFYKSLAVYAIYPYIKLRKWEKENQTRIIVIDQ